LDSAQWLSELTSQNRTSTQHFFFFANGIFSALSKEKIEKKMIKIDENKKRTLLKV